MKIIKHYHDYYDSAIGLAFDEKLVYDRRIEHLSKSNLDMTGAGNVRAALRAMPSTGWGGARVGKCLLAFCGRIYPYWHFLDDFLKYPDDAIEPLHDVGSLCERLRGIAKSEPDSSPWKDIAIRFFRNRTGMLYDLTEEKAQRFSKAASGRTVDVEVFHLLQCPSFLIAPMSGRSWRGEVDGYKIIKNPRLADLHFGAHFDAFACFQELSMFLGGVLARTDQAPQTVGDDVTIARSKGFDEQSFRTLVAGERQERRQRNRARKRGTQ